MSEMRTILERGLEGFVPEPRPLSPVLRRVRRRQRNRRLAVGALALVLFPGAALGILSVSHHRTVPVTPSPATQLWVARFDAAHSGDESQDVTVSPDGTRVFVTGYSYGASTTTQMTTVAYDARTGVRLWAERYPGPAYVHGPDGPGDELSSAVAVSPDGKRVFVTGATGPQGFEDYATLAYDARTGARQWAARYDGPADLGDRPRTLGVSPDGKRVYVTGTSRTSAQSASYLTVAYDAAKGSQLWATPYGGAGASSFATGLAVDPTGTRVYVTGGTGASSLTGNQDFATVAYAARSGATVWTRTYDGRAHAGDSAQAIAVSPDGAAVYVTGTSPNDPRSVGGITTIAYAAKTGAQRWVSHHDDGYPVRAVGVSPDGAWVYVAADSDQSGYLTVALSTMTGAQRWAVTFSAAKSSDIATDLALSPDGTRVYVTGGSVASKHTPYEFTTVTYQAGTGLRVGVARFSGAGKAMWPDAIAVSPDGSRVFVTGPSDGFGFGGSADFLTIAYGAR